MDQRPDDRPLETSLFRAIEKNKIIQSQCFRRQRADSIQLSNNLKSYHLEEKYHRELLYSWKKEAYLLQLKQRLRNTYNVNHAQYEYQVRNLNHLISGQPGLLIPPDEEKRRSDVQAKYQEFLRTHPLQTTLTNRSTDACLEQTVSDEAELARSIEETWKHIHAQSAMWSKRKQNSGLLGLRRSLTFDEIRRKSIRPTTDRTNSASNEHGHFRTNHFELCESVEPPPMTSESLERMTGTDLFTIRSIRRPRQNSAELNSLYEARKRVYQMNKRIMDSQMHQRKCLLQKGV